MAVKTIAVGETVSSSDLNQYLTNAGLVYVKSQTIGTAQSNILVSSAFSAEYENYKIVLSGGVGSTTQAIGLQLDGGTTSVYYGSTITASYNSATVANNTINAAASWTFAGVSSASSNYLSVDLLSPNQPKVTGISGPYINPSTTGNGGFISGYHDLATAYTGFRLIVTGTMTGGTITVYGYRELGTETIYNAAITYNEVGYTYNDRAR